MRALAYYWLIGCVLLGAAFGLRLNKCPNAKLPAGDAIVFVATWPAAFGYAIVSGPSKTECHDERQ